MDQIHTQRQWYQICDAQFGFMTPDYVRKISCKQITNAQVYDSNKNPNQGGLYDQALGVSPNDRQSICKTCGKMGLQCSGHTGHIQLLFPTYNPIVIDSLLKLLKMNCFHCHRFRIKPLIKQDYRIVFALLKKGQVNQANQFMQIDIGTQLKKLKKLKGNPKQINQNINNQINHQQQLLKIQKKINQLQTRKQYLTKKALNQDNNKIQMTQTSIQYFIKFLKHFYSLAQNKCPYCKVQGKIIKKQGANKIFIINKQSKNNNDRKKSKDSTSKGQSTFHATNDLSDDSNKKTKKGYINPKDIWNQLKKLWKNESQLLNLIFGNQYHTNSYSMFFIQVVLVPPSRFRPQSKMGQQKYLHDHSSILARILQNNIDIKHMILVQYLNQIIQRQGQKNKKKKMEQLKQISSLQIKKYQWFKRMYKKLKNKNQFINKWLELQDSINCFIDSKRCSKMADKDMKGVRQILQKKQGLFRMKMMGKRVNYAARSVISPDPSLNTDQVGVPLFMAKKLTFPEHVNQYNLQQLQSYIINGKNYPGAVYLQQNGIRTKIDQLNPQERVSLARSLLINHQNKIIYRHIVTGDNVLFNRQPTLHKPGLMAHRVKVLPKQSTLRMNYANCKSYNADFDGDQMNMHALQNYMSKAQAQLCISDKIYTNPTNGKPIRQLIQDSILAAVYLTMKDTFLTKKDYCQLLYQSTFSILQNRPKNSRLFLLQPAILKPKVLWTGKQLFSNVIKIVVKFSQLEYRKQKGLNMHSTSKITTKYLIGCQQQAKIIIIDNQLITGIIDKNQIGSGSDYGFIHSFNQLYGQTITGKLLTCLTKLFLNYIQIHGFTCGLDDLILNKKTNKMRRNMMEILMKDTVNKICQMYNCKQPNNISYMGRSLFKCDQNGNHIQQQDNIHLQKNQPILQILQKKITTDPNTSVMLDSKYSHQMANTASQINNNSLIGFLKQFPRNNFSMMTLSGAKGSNVNHSQVAVHLGQQQLEGRRVPMMISGKTLPCFYPYDPNPRASGFISDRFLTGLRQQQFFFHCMAGRQGLIDTAVKTSRSGYLQRCLMKHLQALKIQYDYTVRDSDGSIIQFLYGQDGIDPTKQKFINKLQFLQKNKNTFKAKYQYNNYKSLLKTNQIFKFQQENSKKNKYNQMGTLQQFRPGENVGTMSNKCYSDLFKYKRPMEFNQIYSLKYMHAMAQPGQSVGCTAAQSIGQPSTQMTLNTFHLAGHGGVNVTLGIPRLRQILITSSDKIKTPIMQLHFKNEYHLTQQQVQYQCKKLQKIKLIQLIQSINVQQWKQLISKQSKILLSSTDRKRYYKITINYQSQQLILKQFNFSYQILNDKIKNNFIPSLLSYINRVKKKNQLKQQIKRVHQNNNKNQNDDDVDNQDSDHINIDEIKNKNKKNNNNNKDNQQINNLDNQIILEQYNKIYQSQYFQSLSFGNHFCQIKIKVGLNMKKFLMTKVVEKLLKTTIIKQIPGIKSATILYSKSGQPYIQTQGVNFNVIKTLKHIDQYNVSSNDIQAINRNFGIQAARNSIIKEIYYLFDTYGVKVDYRHLYLIGDYVTFSGKVKAMNRAWMAYSTSPFQKMSYQTAVKFISDAALFCQIDHCKTPSSRIVLGQPPILGTGMCDLLMDTGF